MSVGFSFIGLLGLAVIIILIVVAAVILGRNS